MEHSCKSETSRRLIQLALEYAKTLISPQTGYLHYYAPFSEAHHTIPFLDNLHFALILMKTHVAENILQAKELLTSLFNFTVNEQFPSYLHEYPIIKDRMLGAKSLLPLAIILKNYGHVLGAEIKTKIEKIIKSNLAQANTTSPLLELKMQSAAYLSGINPQIPSLESFDWNDLSFDQCAEAALTLYSIANKLPEKLLQRLSKDWHPATQTYIGKPAQLRQHKYTPQITHYDLLMYLLQGSIPQRREIGATHSLLQAAYFPDVCEDHITFDQASTYAIKVQSKQTPLPQHEDHKFHTLYSVWGEAAAPSTFVCQVAPQVFCNAQQGSAYAELEFSFNQPFDGNDDDSAKEISFYLSRTKEPALCTVPAGNTTIFNQNEPLAIQSNGMNIQLTFEVVQGHGNFKGHLLFGNRPAQIADKGQDRFTAFDRQILIRTVSRSLDAKIKVRLQFEG